MSRLIFSWYTSHYRNSWKYCLTKIWSHTVCNWLNNDKIVLGDIREIKILVQYCHKVHWYYGIVVSSNNFLVLRRFTAISLSHCINVHIKCSVVRIEVTYALAKICLNMLIIDLYHTTRLVCFSANHFVYDIMATSKPQKIMISV